MSLDEKDLTFIPADEVPYKKLTKWDAIFSKIPAGQALKLTDKEVNVDTATGALRRRQKQGRYKHIKFISRGPRGKRTAYFINTNKPTKS